MRWLIRKTPLALIVLSVAGLASVPIIAWDLPAAPVAKADLQVDSGLSRAPVSRVFYVDACEAGSVRSDPQCGRQSASTKVGERSPILVTSVLGDLRLGACRGDARSAADGDLAREFPAAQVQASAELVGATMIAVRVTVDPMSPEEVPAGTYCGEILVERESGATHRVTVSVSMDSRTSPAGLVKAVWALLVGACLGVVIRLLKDVGGPLIPLRGRLRAADRRVAHMNDPQRRSEAQHYLESAWEAFYDVDATEAGKWLDKSEKVVDRHTAANSPPAPSTLEIAHGGKALDALLDSYWWTGVSLVLIVVVLSGMQTMYLTTASFSGDTGDYLGLLAFGMAGQITVATVAEAAGRLNPRG